MKVTTDACLFGAWVADKINSLFRINSNQNRILDIGTGTGLLALMVAQKNVLSLIDTVEIDKATAEEAKNNCNLSPWADNISVYTNDINHFIPKNSLGYNFIITNPPFYKEDLKSPLDKRNIAMHSSLLSLEELMFSIKRLLSDVGNFAVLLPYHRADYFIKLAIKEGFWLVENTMVKQTPNHPYFRSMLLFGKTKAVKVPYSFSSYLFW